MYWWLLPCCTALSAWISFFVLQYYLKHRILPRRTERLIQEATDQLVQTITTDKRLSEYLTAPATIQPMMPFIETHIDDFLRHKLGKAMPVVSMFVGDKTINQMKGVFMNELESLLPVVINRFLHESLQPEKLRILVRQELMQAPNHPVFIRIKRQLNSELNKLSVTAACIAFLCGLIMSAIFYGFNIF